MLIPVSAALAAAPVFAGIDRWTPFGPGGGSIEDVVVEPRVAGGRDFLFIWTLAVAPGHRL